MFLGQSLQLRRETTDNTYTGVGTIGHKWLEIRLTAGARAADAYLKRQTTPEGFSQDLNDVWEWLGESGLLIEGAEQLVEEEVAYQAGPCRITGHVDLTQLFRSLGVVTDWKFYNNLSYLVPIEDDLQMYAYAVGTWLRYPELEHIQVHRVACYHLLDHTLDLDLKALKLAKEAIEETVEQVWSNRTTFSPGAQCLSCLLRKSCPAFKASERHLDTAELAPYKGGEIDSAEQVLQFLLAAKAVEERIKEGMKACRAWVEQNGKLEDPQTGKLWGPWASSRDTILDAPAALGVLGQKVGGVEKALAAAKTTKSGMEAVMKAAEMKPAERKAFLGELRERGIMERREADPRWEWRAKKK
jgi:hypothetical protein